MKASLLFITFLSLLVNYAKRIIIILIIIIIVPFCFLAELY